MLKKDELTMMVFAYRYAAERHTSAPSIVCSYITKKIPEMTDEQISSIKKEVKYTLEHSERVDELALDDINKLYCRLCHGNIHVDDLFYDTADDEQVWARVVHNNRYCYWGCKAKDVFPDNLDFYDGCEQKSKLLLDKIIREGFDPAKLPYIEDASLAMQYLWHNITNSNNCMWFVDDEEKIEFSTSYGDWKLTKEEFQRQVDADVEKYHLEDVITKNEDEAMYTCYGDLQSKFSGKDSL